MFYLCKFCDRDTDHFDDVRVPEIGEARAGIGQQVVAAEDGDLVAVLQLQQIVP